MPRERSRRRRMSGTGTALLFVLLGAPQPARSQTNYIPATAALVNLNTGTVCAIGSSMSAIATNSEPAVAAYYLIQNGQGTAWTQVASVPQTVTAFQVGEGGSNVSSIQISPDPQSQPYLNGAAIRFYVTPSGTNCSSITYSITDTAGDYVPPAIDYPYPVALLEMSAYNNGTNDVLTVDTSNVDDFETPLMAEVSNGSVLLGQFGNPVYSPQAATTTMVSSSGGTGGANSPFAAWLQNQPGYSSANGPHLFQSLALSTTPGGYPFAMLESAKDYLSATCLNMSGIYVPSTCNLNGQLLYWGDSLGTYFDSQLSAFFTNAYSNPGTPLIVMGDGSGAISESPWTVISNTANCPIYLNADGESLQFQENKDTGNKAVICNPVGAVVQMSGSPPTLYNQSGQTFQLQITMDQYTADSGYVGWNFGQPETGFAGVVSAITSGNDSYCAGQPCITLTSTQSPNLTYTHWAFSNINKTTYPGLNEWETASQMVFGNDGAFAAWSPTYLSGDLSTVVLSIERNIVAAFSRGIANCNNVTMNSSSGVQEPSFCSGVIATSTINTDNTTPSDEYWDNEANWYPANGTQDYYAQYIHTAQLQGNSIAAGAACTAPSVCSNIFMVPNNDIANLTSTCSSASPSLVADSLQGIPMGMGYGFAYDETPSYPSGSVAQVPSKLDPIPTCWGAGLSLTVVIGRSQTLAAHDFNGDGTSDILWRDTSGELAMWLMSGGQFSSGAAVAQVPSAWSVAGTRDFNGDGDADILWLDNVGDLAIWLMNGVSVGSYSSLGNVGTQWSVVGCGDFNGDGVGDILWRNTSTGELAIWLISNGQLSSGDDLGIVPLAWQVVGTGDFNGDGTSDILWRNSMTGDLAIWFLQNGQFSSSADLGTVPLNWTVVGTGDFNGDGTNDILWRDSSGDLAIWLVSNGQFSSGAALGQIPATWSVAETGDFNGDGMSDILWLDQSGDLAVWLMNGVSVSAYDGLGNVGTGWTVQGQNAD